MTVARVLFLARYRVPHALFSMQFDGFLQGIDRTVIASPVPQAELWPVFERFGIDTARFDYMADQDVLPRYPQVENWVFKEDYRGWWLRQQAIKLSFLDSLDYDVMLMQDPDTFLIEPYCPGDGNQLNFHVLTNTTQSYGYYKTISNALGIQRQTPHCFVTEFVPVLKQDITALREHLENRNSCHWLDAIIQNVPLEPTVPPWGNGEGIRWFSEYEFLGNWSAFRRPVQYTAQRRYEYASLDGLTKFDKSYNAIADAVPDLSLSMQYDWQTHSFPGYQNYLDSVLNRLNELEIPYIQPRR